MDSKEQKTNDDSRASGLGIKYIFQKGADLSSTTNTIKMESIF